MSYPSKHNEDCLPKVVICGITENNMPKLLVCEENIKKDRICIGVCNQERLTSKPSPQDLPRFIPQPKPSPKSGLLDVNNKLQSDLLFKEKTIQTLEQTLCCLQCEMDVLVSQNAKLNKKIQEACVNQIQQQKKSSRKNCSPLENKMNNFNENTKMLEKQVGQMESVIQSMRNELKAVQEERAKREANKKVLMVCPPGWCMPPPSCDPRPPSCGGTKPRQCSLKRTPSSEKNFNFQEHDEREPGHVTATVREFFKNFANLLK